MRITASSDVSAPPEAVWAWVGDLRRYPDFVAGLTHWEAEGRRRSGLGARYRALMRIGSADIGGLVEVVEFHPPADLAWNSVTGAEQRCRWRLRPLGEGETRVQLRLTYHVAGWAPAAWLIGRIAARAIRANLVQTLRELARQVEHSQAERAGPHRGGHDARAASRP
jgi:uncharacterized membrane protein